MHTNSDGYHFPSAQQRCIVHPAGPQAAVLRANGVHAAIAFFFPLAIESPAEPAIANAATTAARANFDTTFIMEQLPRRRGKLRSAIIFLARARRTEERSAHSGFHFWEAAMNPK
jgi:hypothetical protein